MSESTRTEPIDLIGLKKPTGPAKYIADTIEEATRAADDAVAKAHAYEEMLKREEPALFKNHPSPWGLEYRQEAERRIAEGVSELGRDVD